MSISSDEETIETTTRTSSGSGRGTTEHVISEVGQDPSRRHIDVEKAHESVARSQTVHGGRLSNMVCGWDSTT